MNYEARRGEARRGVNRQNDCFLRGTERDAGMNLRQSTNK